MALIVAFTNIKGGVGKTTSSVALASILGRRSGKVLLLDMEGASATYRGLVVEQAGGEVEYELEAVGPEVRPTRLAGLIADAAERCDWLVLDTPANDQDRMDAAVEAVRLHGGLVIVPTGVDDLEMPRALETVRDIDGRAPIRLMLTRVDGRTKESSARPDQLAAASVPVLTATIPRRVDAGRLKETDFLCDLYRPAAVEILAALSE